MKTPTQYILFLAGLLIFSCSKNSIEPKSVFNPSTHVNVPIPDTSGYQGQKILLMNYTGEDCGYCPKSKVDIKMLEELFPNTLLEVNVYTFGSLLNSATAEAFRKINQVNAFPTLQIGYNTLNSLARQYTTKPGAVLSGSEVKPGAQGELKVDVSFKLISALSDELAVNVYLLEDSIPAEGALKQSDYLDLLRDVDERSMWKRDVYSDSTGQLLFQENTVYLHRNVLTNSSEGNDLWGKRIAEANYVEGDELKLQFEVRPVHSDRPYRLLAILWRLENKSVNQWRMVNGDFVQ